MGNFNIPFIVKILDKILPFFFHGDTEYGVVRKLLILKLTMDNRRVPMAGKSQNNGKKKEPKNMVVFNYISYGIIGLFGAGIQMIPNHFLANTIGYGILMFILLSVYIGEYSEVLLDTKGKTFFGALPIREKELAIAKNIHIALYIGGISLVVMLPSIIVGGVKNGLAYGLLYIPMGVLTVLFCLYLAGALYYFLLKMFSGEKLKDLLNVFQVTMTVAIMVGYQIIPRIVDFSAIAHADLTVKPATFLLPSAWFSAPFAIAFQNQINGSFIGLFVVGLGILVGFWILNNKVIAPSFESQLYKLEEGAVENKALPWRHRFFCKVFSKDERERGYMEMVTIHLSRDRALKLKMYPQLANGVIIPLIILLSIFATGNYDGVEGFVENIKSGPYYLALYFMAVAGVGIYSIVCRTDNPDTLWIYQVLPVENLNAYIKSGIKVVLFQYILPLFLGTSIIFLFLYGGGIFVDLIIIYFVTLLLSNISIRLTSWELPFSLLNDSGNTGKALMRGMFVLFLIFLCSIVHGFLIQSFITKLIVIPGVIVLNLLWWKYGMNKAYQLEKE